MLHENEHPLRHISATIDGKMIGPSRSFQRTEYQTDTRLYIFRDLRPLYCFILHENYFPIRNFDNYER